MYSDKKGEVLSEVQHFESGASDTSAELDNASQQVMLFDINGLDNDNFANTFSSNN